MDKPLDLYDEAHLIVAAVRVLAHRNHAPASVGEVAGFLSLSPEAALHTCRKLAAKGIVELVEDPFSSKLFVKDHLKIEDLPRGPQDSSLRDEVESFRKERQNLSQKAKAIREQQEKQRKDLFADLERKLKKGLE